MKKKKLISIESAQREADRLTALAVRKDYERRKEERRSIESQWTLNACFLAGRQFVEIGPMLDVTDTLPEYPWQERQVYNHVAPIVETRLAKLASVRPVMSVRPASSSESDLKTANASTKILQAVTSKMETDNVISRATTWSELTGSAFYKVAWEGGKGRGDVRITAVSPYEIYPDSLGACGLDEVRSLIHARAVPVSEISSVYGKEVEAEDVELALPERASFTNLPDIRTSKRDDCAILIERYEKPSAQKPNGELLIVAGETLLFAGELPYVNGVDGARDLPFVKQDAIVTPGAFFGTSMIERAIPVQRAYNAIKNRKHEFMNRICCGVLAVEDGAVDEDELTESGLKPGSVIVYRQGSQAPRMMDQGNVPSIFSSEEARLEEEFNVITGVSDIMRSSSVPINASSGTAIQLLIDQDDTRLTITSDIIRAAVRDVAKMTLRLYKQFASDKRLTRCVGDDGQVELIEWKGSDLGECDVVYDTVAETANSRSGKQSRLLELLNLGLLTDENGKLGVATKHKLLSAFGYGSWETLSELQSLHEQKADKENLALISGEKAEVDEIDDHEIHERSHIRYMLSGEFEKAYGKDPDLKERMLVHVRSHRSMSALAKEAGKYESQTQQSA
ncbi:MAG: hypothetical protein IJX05_06135 [Clostridia bacterium]|nr:hypothetical protein [Clostridia bacterium]